MLYAPSDEQIAKLLGLDRVDDFPSSPPEHEVPEMLIFISPNRTVVDSNIQLHEGYARGSIFCLRRLTGLG